MFESFTIKINQKIKQKDSGLLRRKKTLLAKTGVGRVSFIETSAARDFCLDDNIFEFTKRGSRKIVTFPFATVDKYNVGKLRDNYPQDLIYEAVQ
ncbi:MAG: hypothetical protein FWF87_05295 [Synergistaceae bacterium]|nr:hypothetical protein [Synergistaceae bacterium]